MIIQQASKQNIPSNNKKMEKESPKMDLYQNWRTQSNVTL